jgi:hypothetical protein
VSIEIKMISSMIIHQRYVIETSRLWGELREKYSLFFNPVIEIWVIFRLRDNEKVSKNLKMPIFVRTHKGDLTEESRSREK